MAQGNPWPGRTSRESSYSSTASCDSHVFDPFSVVVLEHKNISRYTIPSFSAIQMNLCHVVLQCWEDDVLQCFDGFIHTGRDLPALNRQGPATIGVLSCCIVPVSF